MVRVWWRDALARGREVQDRCAQVARRPLMFSKNLQWALPIYALAGDNEQGVARVEFAQLRYRLADRDHYLTWLCAALQRMGHHVQGVSCQLCKSEVYQDRPACWAVGRDTE